MDAGIINWFSHEKGFGVINTNPLQLDEDGIDKKAEITEVFLHKINWKDKVEIDEENNIPVVFEITYERGKYSAKNCRYFFNDEEHWNTVFNNYHSKNIISIKGSKYYRYFNIVEQCFLQLKDGYDRKPIDSAIENFVQKSDNEVLIIFLGNIHEIVKQIPYNSSFGKIMLQIKNSDGENFLDFLKSIISKSCFKTASEIKFWAWEKQYLNNESISVDDFIKVIENIKIEHLERIKNHSSYALMVSEFCKHRIKVLDEKFEIRTFLEFDKLVQTLEDKFDRENLMKDLNGLASNYYIKAIETEIESLPKERYNWISSYEKIIEEFPAHLDAELKNKLIETTERWILKKESVERIIEALNKSFFRSPSDILIYLENSLSNSELLTFIKSQLVSFDKKVQILNKLAESHYDYETILSRAKELGTEEYYDQINKTIKDRISDEQYLQLWERGNAKIKPYTLINLKIDADDIDYSLLTFWINRKLISEDYISSRLINKLEQTDDITNWSTFHSTFKIIEYLTNLNESNIQSMRTLNKGSLTLMLWFLDLDEDFDFEVLKRKFIFFKPEQQVLILKKLFKLKALGIFNLTTSMLTDIIKVDLDLYKINLEINPELELDLSSAVVIEALSRFEKEGKFLVESDLITVVLQNIGADKTRKFQFGDYFDKCTGRKVLEFNWRTTRIIKKENFGNNQHYYRISFDYESEIVDKVKMLPMRKYNPKEEFWGVPSKFENEVIDFGRKNGFKLLISEKIKTDNYHLVELKNFDNPPGIVFCEGQQAQNEHQFFRRKFWWCANQACFENAENLHNIDDWNDYTLLDFTDILKLSTVEKNGNEVFPIGKYNQFISQLNRFSHLLEHMYCRKCKHILYPVRNANYAAYNVVEFSCQNNKCEEHNKVIYLNHCLNGKCNEIIDSRDSKKCPNSLFICCNCGSCCSHAVFKRKLDNLETIGGNIPNNLRIRIDNKIAHLEKAEYYCHKCGKMMTSGLNSTFKCFDCKVVYVTAEYEIDRIHLNLRRNDYPQMDLEFEKQSSRDKLEDDYIDEDLPY